MSRSSPADTLPLPSASYLSNTTRLSGFRAPVRESVAMLREPASVAARPPVQVHIRERCVLLP